MKKLLFSAISATLLLFSSCKKDVSESPVASTEDMELRAQADDAIAQKNNEAAAFQKQWKATIESNRSNKTITETAVAIPIFKSLVAAVVKTDLAGVLSTPGLNATVFAPTDAAFAKLPAPFNNPANINAISDPAQISALRNILLYHVLGSQVRSNQVQQGQSSAVTLKPAGTANDNTIYFSNNFGLILVNGNSLVLLPNVQASNGVIHVIDDVLLPPSQNIAEIAIGNPDFSSLVAALVKTNLAGVFTGAGDFTVFAPTNAAFAALPAPFNNAANINAITDQSQVDALANILRYHVVSSRNFAWDLGFFRPVTTLADAPNNKLIGVLGFNSGYVKGNSNNGYARITPANILAVNGVIHVINKVLLP